MCGRTHRQWRLQCMLRAVPQVSHQAVHAVSHRLLEDVSRPPGAAVVCLEATATERRHVCARRAVARKHAELAACRGQEAEVLRRRHGCGLGVLLEQQQQRGGVGKPVAAVRSRIACWRHVAGVSMASDGGDDALA